METLSEKVKIFLNKKRELIGVKIKKLKRKRKRIKILYYSLVVSSISLSAIIASLTGFIGVPAVVLTSLSTGSGILTALSAKFNLSDIKLEIEQLIDKLNKLNHKIDYIVTCNGNLSKEEYEQILKDWV
jgi:hypothetical protein